jgi:hypothetical protein
MMVQVKEAGKSECHFVMKWIEVAIFFRCKLKRIYITSSESCADFRLRYAGNAGTLLRENWTNDF